MTVQERDTRSVEEYSGLSRQTDQPPRLRRSRFRARVPPPTFCVFDCLLDFFEFLYLFCLAPSRPPLFSVVPPSLGMYYGSLVPDPLVHTIFCGPRHPSCGCPVLDLKICCVCVYCMSWGCCGCSRCRCGWVSGWMGNTTYDTMHTVYAYILL